MALREFLTGPSRCELGFQTNNFTQGNVASLAALYAGCGGKVFETQFSWPQVEDYASGTLALPAIMQAALQACVTYNLKPLVVAAYGPPWTNLQTVTVASDVAAGSYAIPTVEATGTIDYPSCYLLGPANSAVTANNYYYGSLIDSVGANQLNLASVTSVFLPAGTVLQVTRLRYPAIGTASLTDTSTLAYIRYWRFLAAQIAAYGLTGWVQVWNELPWHDDQWPQRSAAYDSGQVGHYASLPVNTVAFFQTVLAASVTTTPIAGVTMINGASTKGGLQPSMVSLGTITTAAELALAYGDGIHPYGTNPENDSWYNGAGCTRTNLSALWTSSNFSVISQESCQLGATLGQSPILAATECGTPYQGSDKAAVNSRYLRRRVLSLWGNGVSPVCIHDLENDPTDIYDIISQGASACLLTLAQQIASLGGEGGTSVPTVTIGSPSWDVMKVCIKGANGTLTLLWQRTEDASNWNGMTRATPTTVTLTPPAGHTVTAAIDLETGNPVTIGPTFQVADDILLVKTQPQPAVAQVTPGSNAPALLRRGIAAAA